MLYTIPRTIHFRQAMTSSPICRSDGCAVRREHKVQSVFGQARFSCFGVRWLDTAFFLSFLFFLFFAFFLSFFLSFFLFFLFFLFFVVGVSASATKERTKAVSSHRTPKVPKSRGT